jgi:hypothetical protein
MFGRIRKGKNGSLRGFAQRASRQPIPIRHAAVSSRPPDFLNLMKCIQILLELDGRLVVLHVIVVGGRTTTELAFCPRPKQPFVPALEPGLRVRD